MSRAWMRTRSRPTARRSMRSCAISSQSGKRRVRSLRTPSRQPRRSRGGSWVTCGTSPSTITGMSTRPSCGARFSTTCRLWPLSCSSSCRRIVTLPVLLTSSPRGQPAFVRLFEASQLLAVLQILTHPPGPLHVRLVCLDEEWDEEWDEEYWCRIRRYPF